MITKLPKNKLPKFFIKIFKAQSTLQQSECPKALEFMKKAEKELKRQTKSDKLKAYNKAHKIWCNCSAHDKKVEQYKIQLENEA